MNIQAVIAGASLFLTGTLSAQAIRPVFVTGAVGVGATSGADTLYQASPARSLRLGIGLRVRDREFEVSAIHEDYLDVVIHPSDYACDGGPCPVNYRFEGLAAGAWIGRPRADASFRFQAGAGLYRLVAQHPYQRHLMDATTLGIHLDAEAALMHSQRTALLLGVRPIFFVNVHDSHPWALPIELRLRIR